MSRYLCLVSGQLFESKSEAEEHAVSTHNLSLSDALHTNKIFVELNEGEDPEKVYREYVER